MFRNLSNSAFLGFFLLDSAKVFSDTTHNHQSFCVSASRATTTPFMSQALFDVIKRIRGGNIHVKIEVPFFEINNSICSNKIEV